MKSLLIRIGVLGVLFLLGWIAIAHAQRGGEFVEAQPQPAAVPMAAPNFARPAPATVRREANPLRAPEVRPPSSDIPDAEPGLNRPVADPFGPRCRYPNTPASAEEPMPAGPALAPVNAARPPRDRYSPSPTDYNRTADSRNAGYPVPSARATPVSTNGEPAPFRADPYAVPASPTPIGGNDPNMIGMTPPGGFSNHTNQAPLTSDGTGQPGDPRLEGVQSPQLTIQKSAPKEIQVGKSATFSVVVRNVGQTPACNVEIHDRVPRGTRLTNTRPQAKRGARGELVWILGTIQPGQESVVEMEIVPTNEGEIGSVATVHFAAAATARSIVTRPQLVVETAMPAKALIGDQVMLSIVVSNPGTGVATGVVIEEHIPVGLHHPAGSELEYTVGDLKPGESRKLDLPLVANRAGAAVNMLVARGDGDLRVEDKRELEVLAPLLEVALKGPKRRYLERQATYQLSIANPGTATAEGVELVASLPTGLKFVSANNAGHYEESTRTVHWRLEKLPAKEVGSVQLVTLPVEAGQHAIHLRGTAEKGLVVEKEQPVTVEGIAAILFQVADHIDPIGPGGETTYEIRVMNQGTKAATNVQVAVLLPPELQPVAAEGPTRYAMDGNRVFFEGLASLAPKAETVYRVKAKALRAGDLRVRIQLKTDNMQIPVTKEESTRVFADQ